MELRSLANWIVRPRLLSGAGVSQVTFIGGEQKQFQVLVDPAMLTDYGLSLKEVSEAVASANANAGGGFVVEAQQEYLIRGRGCVYSPEDLANSVIMVRNGVSVLVKNIAEVKLGAALKRGDGNFNLQPAVVATITKQPTTSALETTQMIEGAIASLKASLPADVKIETKAFQQADFIKRSIYNVEEALLVGAALVLIVLFAFL
jgi:Cu/Ag efflux pump CusA